MKKSFIISIFAALFSVAVASAQTTREEIDMHPHIAMATQSVYAAPYFFKPLADAPKGYKPFYISHYGRHGSRYESREIYRSWLHNVFHYADSLNLLTEKGRELKAYADKVYDAQYKRVGELTRVGFEQHKGIARRMYENFKPLFSKGAIIESRSSVRNRCIMSMAAFNESLKECEPMLETRMDVSERFQIAMRPVTGYNPLYTQKLELLATSTKRTEWGAHLLKWAENQSFEEPLSKIFTDYRPIQKLMKSDHFNFTKDLYKRLCFAQNIGWHDRSMIDEIFSPEVRHKLFIYDNYYWFNSYCSTSTQISRTFRALVRPLVEDIIEYADAAVAGKNNCTANLRFGHDYFLLELLGVMNFNEIPSEFDISDVEAACEKWRGYRIITMASNLQMVFYKSKKSPDVLVRFLHNENDVHLPIEAVEGPFYKWSDVRQYMLDRLAYLDKK